MTVQSSGKIMVRVPRAHFQAMMSGGSLGLGAVASTTVPLFGSTHAVGMVFGVDLPTAQQRDWLLHEPRANDLHPWDAAHLVVQGKLAGSEQFAGTTDAYAEPDLLNTRQVPDRGLSGGASPGLSGAASPSGPPWSPLEGLNTHYPPTADQSFSPVWHLEPDHGNFFAAWALTKGAGVRIAHLDTGYTPGHMSTPRGLQPQQGYNFYEKNTVTVDPYIGGLADEPGHGTATLALLAGKKVSMKGASGEVYDGDFGGAPDAQVVPVRIGPSVIHLYTADLAQGLDYALAPRSGGMCDVVSLSHGGLPSNAWAAAVNRLYEKGVVVVAAAGDSFYLKVMDVATHFTVYPSAFYRVVTATGATFTEGPYVTSDFGVMQGCWGPDKVMEKAAAAYTPNVAWMSYKSLPGGWDMDGGGTSASTPQIAAACALWLAQYGKNFPQGWQRIEACRHALFTSLRAKAQNLGEIGAGLLDAGRMLSTDTLSEVNAAFQANRLPFVQPDAVSFPFFRLLFGLAPPGSGVDEMYEVEAAQIFFRSANTELAGAVADNPEGSLDKTPSPATAARLREAFLAQPSISQTLKAYLQSKSDAPGDKRFGFAPGTSVGGNGPGRTGSSAQKRPVKLGWVPDLPDKRDYAYAAPLGALAILPPAVDLRPQIPFAPYDQGDLLSCTANAIAGAIEFDRLKSNQNPDFVPSRLFIYFNERTIEQRVAMDSGAQIRDGIKSVAAQGACPELQWPYVVNKADEPDPDTKLFPPNSPAVETPTAECYATALKFKALAYFSVAQTLPQLKGCLAEGYPFIFGFSVYDNMFDANNQPVTILAVPGPTNVIEGGHAVTAVGYDDTTQMFTIRNSWGTQHQDKGYFYMPYKYVLDNNLADDFWTIRGMSR